MATYYVRKTGNDGNPGTNASPRLTIASGLSLLSPGDTLIVGDGTYAESVTISSGGSAGAYKTIRAENKRLAILSGGGWGFNIQANYIAIDGFKFAKTGGGGGVQCGWERHHITVQNCEMDGGTDHGIAGLGGEFYLFEGNYIHGGRYSDFWSAISIYQGRNVTGDTTTAGFRNIIRNNICDDNYQTPGSGFHTDGNGIIVDDLYHTQAGTYNYAAWSGVSYPYPTLIENNLCTRNGGKGIQVFVSAYVTVRNNTAAFNNRDSENDGTWRGEINCATSDYCVFANNVGVTRSNASGAVGSGPTSRLTSNSGLGWFSGSADMPNTVWRNNLGWDIDASKNNSATENAPHALSAGNGHVFADPLFVDQQPDGVGNYRLQSGSPAINVGSAAYGLPTLDLAGNLRTAGGTVDIGAYEYGSVSGAGMILNATSAVYLGSTPISRVYLGSTLIYGPPTLTSITDTANGANAATGSVSTDKAAGMLYWVVSTSATAPSAAQVRAGQMHTGAAAAASGSQAVTATGAQAIAPSGLTASTGYWLHAMHEMSVTCRSAVASGDGFTTAAPPAGISYVSGSTTTYASRTNTTVTAPAGIANGDILRAAVFTMTVGGEAPDPTPPAGFTEIGSAIDVTDGGSVNGEMRVYYKPASGESGNYTFTHATCSSQARIDVLRGVNLSTPLDAASTANSGTGTTRTWTGLTTVTNGAWIDAIGFDWADAANNLTPPSGMTERADTTLLYAATEERATAGATANRSHTCNSGSSPANPWGARLIAWRPA